MTNYLVEYQKICLTQKHAKPHGMYKFNVSANSLFEASRIAALELGKIGFMSDSHDVWNATIYDPATKEAHEILKEGGWLQIGDKSDKPKETLENRLNQ